MGRRKELEKRKTGTRDAVETAIEMARGDKRVPWESLAAKSPKRISLWKTESRHAMEDQLTKEEFDNILKKVARPLTDQSLPEKSET